MTRSRLRFPLVILAILAAGCFPFPRERYDLEMVAVGPVLHRQLTCWHEADRPDKPDQHYRFSPAELAALAEVYGRPPEAQPGRNAFSGEFSGRLPATGGGAGFYLHFTSRLGTVSAYCERIGDNDPAASLDRRQEKADRFADWLAGWCRHAAAGRAGAAELLAVVEGEVRPDLRELVRQCWLAELLAANGQADVADLLLRPALFLVERGYLQPETLPRLLRVGDGRESAAAALDLLRRALAAKMGRGAGDPLPPALDFLRDEERLQASLNAYREAVGEEAGAPPEMDRALFSWWEVPAAETFTIRLLPAAAPFAVNGEPDAASGVVSWARRLPRGLRQPALCYAVWSEPDAGFQEARFGRVVLAGEKLAEYVIWRNSLAAAEEAEWDAFLDELVPGEDLVEQVRAFRFSRESPANSPCVPLREGRRLLLDGLAD